jgi:hypothetical protein
MSVGVYVRLLVDTLQPFMNVRSSLSVASSYHMVQYSREKKK